MRAGNDFQDKIWLGKAADAGGRLQPGLDAGGSGANAARRRRRCGGAGGGSCARPTPTTPDIMKDIDVSKLDWSQLNVEPPPCPLRHRRAAPRRRASRECRRILVFQSEGERRIRRVGQAVGLAVLGHTDRRRHDGCPAGHADGLRTAVGETGQRRQPAAIVRHRVGGDHRARRGLDLGQDRGGSPRRSRHRSRASSAPP